MKKTYSILILLTVLSLGSSFGQVPSNGLVGYWSFNGNANDNSGNGNNGTVNGATLTSDRFGNLNSAYSFDGKTSSITIPHSSTLTFASNQITFSFWMNAPSYPLDSMEHYIISKHSGSGTTTNGFQVLIADFITSQRFGYRAMGTNTVWSGISIPYTNLPNPNNWFHAVMSNDKINSKIYINGNLISTSPVDPASTIGSATNTAPIYLGIPSPLLPKSTTRGYKGILDDIRIYNRALSSSEITSLYNENVCFKTVSVTDTLRITTVLGLNDLPLSFGNVKVYPNPSHDILNISVSNPSTNYSIEILNGNGITVYSSVLNTSLKQLNTSILGAKGLYLIKIKDNSNSVLDTRKLVLE